jgi:arginine exporter protein ArgO
MINKILKNIFVAFLLSIVLLIVGLAIKYLILDSKTPLQDILFWVGAIPIMFFSVGVFGDFFGKGDSSYQLSRSVSNQSSNQRGFQDVSDIKSRAKFGLNWILAGLLIWFYSYFM